MACFTGALGFAGRGVRRHEWLSMLFVVFFFALLLAAPLHAATFTVDSSVGSVEPARGTGSAPTIRVHARCGRR